MLRESLAGVRFKLYCTHAFQTWGDRWWLFALGLFLVILSPDEGSLRVTATNSIMISLSLILFSHISGHWIDKYRRITVIRFCIFCKNFCIVGSCMLVYFLLQFPQHRDSDADMLVTNLCLTAVFLFSVMGGMAFAVNNIALSKDWIVVLANAEHFTLTEVNAWMRRIDMMCNIVAPVSIALVMRWPGRRFAILFIAGWNVVSAVCEYCLLRSIYLLEPALAQKTNHENGSRPSNSGMPLPQQTDSTRAGDKTRHESESPLQHRKVDKLLFFFNSFRKAVNIYLSYQVKFAGIALAMLYMTVLNFNSATNGYMMLQGFSELHISLTTAASSISGIIGTILFPFLVKQLGLTPATFCGSLIQISFLSIAVVSFFLPGSPWHVLAHYKIHPESDTLLSVTVFASGVTLSRAGLWMFDLGATQLIQQQVNLSECGRFNSIQQCLQSTFDLVYLLLVIVFPRCDTYAWLGFTSYVAIVSAGCILFYYGQKERSVPLNCLFCKDPSASETPNSHDYDLKNQK